MVLLIGVRFYKESTKNTDKIFFVVSNFIILFAAMTSSSRRGVIIGSVVLLSELLGSFFEHEILVAAITNSAEAKIKCFIFFIKFKNHTQYNEPDFFF